MLGKNNEKTSGLGWKFKLIIAAIVLIILYVVLEVFINLPAIKMLRIIGRDGSRGKYFFYSYIFLFLLSVYGVGKKFIVWFSQDKAGSRTQYELRHHSIGGADEE